MKEYPKMMSVLEKNIEYLYGNDPAILDRQKKRFNSLCRNFQDRYTGEDLRLISTPGRTEISGNHTDHNNGKVIAASIDLDTVGVAARNDVRNVVLYSGEFQKEFIVSVDDLDARQEERESTTALMRGILKGFKENGYAIGGCTCYLQSDVHVGSGLSSSASIEVLIGSVLNVLYNDGKIDPLEIARIGRYAENEYFGKPCGMMDQVACAYGGVVGIDFENQNKPKIEKLEFDLRTYGYCLLIVDTGSIHNDLTSEYASVPGEMRKVAEAFGKRNCREISREEFFSHLPEFRRTLHERPLLRALHFLEENERVEKQIVFLKQGRFYDFLALVNESGNSSIKLLQNIYPPNNALQQPLSLGLALTERYISSVGEGAVRIHGGGFAGTYQVFLPSRHIVHYRNLIEPLFGIDCVKNLKIRKQGAFTLL